LVLLAQVNLGGVFQDETADILLLDRVAVAVPLRASRCASEFGLQMAALDPAPDGVRADPLRLRRTVGGVETPAMLEPHPLQLKVDSGYRARVSGTLQLEPDAFIAHPRQRVQSELSKWWRPSPPSQPVQ
jgi:hypothetical protein